MYKKNVVSVSTARKNLSSILDTVFVEDEEFIVTKRNIPVAKIVRAKDFRSVSDFKKELDLSLFGVFASSKKNALELAAEFRKRAWFR